MENEAVKEIIKTKVNSFVLIISFTASFSICYPVSENWCSHRYTAANIGFNYGHLPILLESIKNYKSNSSGRFAHSLHKP